MASRLSLRIEQATTNLVSMRFWRCSLVHCAYKGSETLADFAHRRFRVSIFASVQLKLVRVC